MISISWMWSLQNIFNGVKRKKLQKRARNLSWNARNRRTVIHNKVSFLCCSAKVIINESDIFWIAIKFPIQWYQSLECIGYKTFLMKRKAGRISKKIETNVPIVGHYFEFPVTFRGELYNMSQSIYTYHKI